VTRNAVNPRHAFSDTNAEAQDALADSTEHAAHSAKEVDDVDAPVVAGEHITDNLQAVDKPKYTDNLQALDETNVTDNWQSLGKAHLQDNLQDVDTDAFHDNRQSLGDSQSIQEQKLYLEKKSIRDNRQKVTSTVAQRAAPQVPVHTSTPPLQTQAVLLQNSASSMPVTPTSATPNNAMLAVATKLAEDDELRARMKKLKATVQDVSHTLSDLAPKP
jgi:hypothetical protein